MERHVNIALWVIAGLLAAAFLAAGITELVKSKQALEADPRQAWAHDFSAGAIKAIGVTEVLGALGLILPAVTGIAVVLVPLAALGLAVTMVGAIVVHLRRGERQAVVAPVLLLVMSAVVAWGRFGPYAF
jgi:uncharacterized membrane protein